MWGEKRLRSFPRVEPSPWVRLGVVVALCRLSILGVVHGRPTGPSAPELGPEEGPPGSDLDDSEARSRLGFGRIPFFLSPILAALPRFRGPDAIRRRACASHRGRAGSGTIAKAER